MDPLPPTPSDASADARQSRSAVKEPSGGGGHRTPPRGPPVSHAAATATTKTARSVAEHKEKRPGAEDYEENGKYEEGGQDGDQDAHEKAHDVASESVHGKEPTVGAKHPEQASSQEKGNHDGRVAGKLPAGQEPRTNYAATSVPANTATPLAQPVLSALMEVPIELVFIDLKPLWLALQPRTRSANHTRDTLAHEQTFLHEVVRFLELRHVPHQLEEWPGGSLSYQDRPPCLHCSIAGTVAKGTASVPASSSSPAADEVAPPPRYHPSLCQARRWILELGSFQTALGALKPYVRAIKWDVVVLLKGYLKNYPIIKWHIGVRGADKTAPLDGKERRDVWEPVRLKRNNDIWVSDGYTQAALGIDAPGSCSGDCKGGLCTSACKGSVASECNLYGLRRLRRDNPDPRAVDWEKTKILWQPGRWV